MKICYGISNGPFLPYHMRPTIDSPEAWLWRTGPCDGIGVESRDDLILDVPKFDPTKSAPVKITLRRKGVDTPIIEVMANGCLLYGPPELVWNDGYPHVYGVER